MANPSWTTTRITTSVMAIIDDLELRLRRHLPEQASQAVELSAEAGWNQIESDWRLMMEMGDASSLWDRDEHLVATALMLPFDGPFGWISMVLVTSGWQRRGLATELLKHSMDGLRGRGLVPGLDATEGGREVYAPLGFRDVYPIVRMRADRIDPGRLPKTSRNSVRSIEKYDAESVRTYDRAVFGAGREALLDDLRGRAPDLAWLADEGSGFVLGRDGRVATQIGPLSADNIDAAKALLGRALENTAGPTFIDVPAGQAEFVDYLAGAGFRPQRGFMRMLFGRSEPFDDPERVFAVAGPELG